VPGEILHFRETFAGEDWIAVLQTFSQPVRLFMKMLIPRKKFQQSGALFLGEFFRLPGELIFAKLGAEIVGNIFKIIHELAVLVCQVHVAHGIYRADGLFLFGHSSYTS
jgi:hypothetical protein